MQWALGLALTVASAASAVSLGAQQNGTITGRITDAASGQPLAAAQVSITGTTRGSATGDDGRYRIIGVPPGSYTVRVLRIGYQAQTRALTVAAGQTVTFDAALAATAVSLDQVVVTATGEQIRRREQGNVVSSIQPSTAELAATNTVTDVLNSRTPGVYVQQSSGGAGTGSRVRIRGANSLSLNNEPLLIIDGVRANNDVGNRSVTGGGVGTNVGTGGQVTSRLNDINPEDIESIEVIKGPAGVAIYGTAAANGVIQITTRKGRAGRTRWAAYGELGNGKLTADLPSNYGNLGTFTTGSPLQRQCTNDARTRGLCTQGTLRSLNPLRDNSPFRNANRQVLGGNASGGNERLTYYVGGDYQQEDGIQRTNNVQKYTVRANFRGELRPNLDVSFSSGYVHDGTQLPVNDNSTLGLLSVGLLGRPLASDTLSGGYFNNFTPQQLENLSSHILTDRYTTALTSNLQAASWLSFTGQAGLDYVDQLTRQQILPNRVNFGDLPQGSANSNPLQIYTWTTQGTATANFKLSESLASTTQAGSQYSRELFRGTNAFGAVLTAGSLSLSGTSARFAVSEFNTDNVTIGGFAQERLAWHDRLFVTGGVRGDRNSAFGNRIRFTYYPFANASYVISDEPFFPTIPGVSSVQLRAAWGNSGQRPEFRNAITYFNPVAVRADAQELSAITFSGANVGDPQLKPERTTETELGFDLGLLTNRANLAFTYYNKTTSDLLVQVPVPGSVGGPANQFRNAGKMRNRGLEVQLTGTLLDTRPAKVDLNLGVTTNDNKVLALAQGVPLIPLGTQQHRPGLPAGAFFQRPYTYQDKNADGLIARTEVTLGDTAVYLGNPLPRREVEFQPGLTLFNTLRVSSLFSYRGGFKVLNSTNRFRCVFSQNCRDVNDPSAPLDLQARAIAGILGTDAGYIEDGSFVRLRELAFTLTLPKRYTRIPRLARFDEASLTIAGRNLATWTDYTGLDPEITSTPGQNFVSSEFLTVPPVRYWTARLNLTF